MGERHVSSHLEFFFYNESINLYNIHIKYKLTNILSLSKLGGEVVTRTCLNQFEIDEFHELEYIIFIIIF